VPAARLGAIIAGAFVSFATSAAVFACLLVFLAACAVLGFVLYGSAHLLAYAFGIEFRWGLVIACWILLIGAPAGAFVHDWRMHRRLALRRRIRATDF
jgi:Ni/Fe-hydrogenase subunit HybB-like protein